MSTKIVKRSAFSLIELSLVLVVLSVIVAAALPARIVEIKTQEVKQNSIDINLLYQAIGRYVIINKKLPCPAALDISITDNTQRGQNYGKSVGQDGDCQGQGVYLGDLSNNLVYGMIPVNELGLISQYSIDGYNNKIIYVVDRRLTDAKKFDADYPNPEALITVKDNISQQLDSANSSTNLISKITKADFLIMSLGKNNHGAFLAKSTKLEKSSFDIDEMENHIDEFYQFNDIFVSNSASQNFDDKLIFKKRDDLIKDFGLANLIRCKAKNEPEIIDENDKIFAIWQKEGFLGQFVTSECPAGYDSGYIARKCGANGQWSSLENYCVKFAEVDGGWSNWSSWDGCSKSNNGTTTRYRSCNNPTPRGLGKNCQGEAIQKKECNITKYSYRQGSWMGMNRLRKIMTKNKLNDNGKIYKLELIENLQSIIEANNGYYRVVLYNDSGNEVFSHIRDNLNSENQEYRAVYDFDQALSVDKLQLQIYTAKSNPYRVVLSDVEIIIHYLQE